MTTAASIAPAVAALLAEAAQHRKDGRLEAAERAYAAVLDRDPRMAAASVGLAQLYLNGGQPAQAAAILLAAASDAATPDLWITLALALSAMGDDCGAWEYWDSAWALRADDPRLARTWAEAAVRAGQTDSALKKTELALSLGPDAPAALAARATLLLHLGRPSDAADLLELALASRPHDADLASARASALVQATRFADSVPAFRRAVELAPAHPTHRNNLAAALNRCHRYEEGKAVLDALIAEAGENPAFLSNLTNALVSLGRQKEGVEVAQRAVRIAPEQAQAWRTLASALAYCDGVSAAEVLQANCRAGALLPRRHLGVAPARPRDGGRLRLGLLSPTLHTHPVGWLTVAPFEALDPRSFEIVCFGPVPSGDRISRRFRALAAEWYHVVGRRTEDIAAQIANARVDILIDLGGWGDQGMLAACAWRPAPVQVKWVGMQSGSTGLPEIDWFISDRWETPHGTESLYTERLLRLPDGYVCYSPPDDAPDVMKLPADERGAVTFGCFNNLAKVTPSALRAWAAILRRIPDSRLVLQGHALDSRPVSDSILRVFAASEIDSNRVDTVGSLPHRALLARYNNVDVSLDPFPYTGGLTACESLWMGVPVVTLAGEAFCARHATSHVSNVGLPELVAADENDYVERAVALATDVRRLRSIRRELRPSMRSSALCDGPRFARNLEKALLAVWRSAHQTDASTPALGRDAKLSVTAL